MSKSLVNEKCPMFGKECRHCSSEHSSRPYMKLDKDPRTGRFKPGGLGRMQVDLGCYCNDAGKYIDTMHFCPIKWDEANKSIRDAEYAKKIEKEARAVKRKEPKLTKRKYTKKKDITIRKAKK